MIHNSYRLNVVLTANAPASVDLQQNFLKSDSCFSVYAKAIKTDQSLSQSSRRKLNPSERATTYEDDH